MEHFKTLRVPLETQSRLKNVKKLQAEEEKNIAVLEESMIKLQVRNEWKGFLWV